MPRANCLAVSERGYVQSDALVIINYDKKRSGKKIEFILKF